MLREKIINKVKNIYQKGLELFNSLDKGRSKKGAKKTKDYILKNKKFSPVLAGAVTIFAYAPFSLWIFIFISFIVLNLLLNNEKRPKQRMFIVFVFAYTFNVVNLHWVGNSFLYNAPEPWLVYFMPLIILLMGLILTLPYVVIFYLLDKIKMDHTVKSIFLVPVVFALVEFLRSLTVYGFPWNLTGYAIAHNDYLLQISEFGSIITVSFLILLIAALLAKLEQKYVLMGIMIFAWWFIVGSSRFEYLENHKKHPSILDKTKIIQQDKAEHHGFNRDKMREQVLFYLEGLRGAKTEKSQPKLITFPEMSIPYPIEKTSNLLNIFQDSLSKGDTLILGSPAFDNDNVYNAMYYITKDEFKRYDKKLLVPFGEFIPFRFILDKVKNFTNNVKDFAIGEKPNIVEINGQKYLSLICYEAIFPSFVKNHLKDNKDVILMNITNDAWFYGTIAPYQHALIAKARAVENGLPMVRIANTGISYINY